MMRSIALAALLVVSAPLAAHAACADSFKFEPDARLSPQAYLKASEWMQSEEMADGTRLYFLSFDREDRPQRGEWSVVGAVVVSAGTGSIAVGGILWGRSSVDLYSGGDQEQFRKGREGVTLSLSMDSIVAACRGSYIFRLDKENRLFANGVFVGQMKYG